MEEENDLLTTGNTPAPIEATSKRSKADLYNEIIPSLRDSKPTNSEIARAFEQTSAVAKRIKSSDESDLYTADQRAEMLRGAGDTEYFGGLNFDYNYAGARPLITDDLAELQAQNQSNWAKRKAGIGRMFGEFALNVAEIPGVVGGAVGAAATADINKMTDNFWVNYTNSLKDSLHEALPVYQRRAVTEGGVWDKMSSIDWWATDGASGIAFMGAALVPGLGLTKLPKALSITRYLGASGKVGKSVLASLDDIAAKTGMAEKALLGVKEGAAAKKAIDVVNVTMANTLYEAGVEARSGQISYKNQMFDKLQSGEITMEEYESALAYNNEAAGKVFAGNMGLLLVPNLMMSKMMLGAKALNVNKVAKEINYEAGVNAFSKVGKEVIEEGAGKATKGFGGKAFDTARKIVKSDTAKGIGTYGGMWGKATFREGLVEEAGQMSLEHYYTEGLIEEKLKGERKKNMLQTYADVVGSTDGQVAVLFGGILGSPMDIYSKISTDKRKNKYIDSAITDYNRGADYNSALRQDFYKYEVINGEKVYELDKDNKRVPDNVKIAQFGQAAEVITAIQTKIDEALEKGEDAKAAALASKLQAVSFMPFMSRSEEGLEALEDMLLNSPVTDLTVQEHNNTTGDKLTKEEFVRGEMAKAKQLQQDLVHYVRNIEEPISNSFLREMNLKRGTKEFRDAEAAKVLFDNMERSAYVEMRAAEYSYSREIANLESSISKAEKDGQIDTKVRLETEKAKADTLLKSIKTTLRSIESPEEISKRWGTFYKAHSDTQKINSGEVSGYLDTLITDIKKAKSEEEVEIIIAKAKEEGLILPMVEITKFPEELSKMVSSDNVIESIGALHLVNAHRDAQRSDELDALMTEAARNINRIYEATQGLINDIIPKFRELTTEHTNLLEEAMGIQKKIEQLTEDIDLAIEALNSLENSKSKATISKAYRESYLKLLRAKKSIIKERSELEVKLNSTQSQIENIYKKYKGYLEVSYGIANSIPNLKIKTAVLKGLDSIVKEDGKSKEIKEITFNSIPFNSMPLTLQDIKDALYANKELLMNEAEKIGGLVISTATLEVLNHKKQAYSQNIKVLTNLLDTVNKLLRKFEQHKNKEKTAEIIAELRAEIIEIENAILVNQENIQEINDRLEINLFTTAAENSEFVQDIEHIITSIDEISIGKKPTTPDTINKPTMPSLPSNEKEFLVKLTNLVNEYNKTKVANVTILKDLVDALEINNPLLLGYVATVENIFNKSIAEGKYISLISFEEYVYSKGRVGDTTDFLEGSEEGTDDGGLDNITFTPLQDKTNGNGATRVNPTHQSVFRILFSKDKATIENSLKYMAKNVVSKGELNLVILGNLALILDNHTQFGSLEDFLINNLSKEDSKLITKKDIEFAREVTNEVWKEYNSSDIIPNSFFPNNATYRGIETEVLNTIEELNKLIDRLVIENYKGEFSTNPKAKELFNKLVSLGKIPNKTDEEKLYHKHINSLEEALGNKIKNFNKVSTKKIPAVIETINNTNIKEEILKLLDIKKQELRDAKAEEIAALSKYEAEAWRTAQGEKEAFTIGNEVHWDEEGDDNIGEIVTLLKSNVSGANALIKHSDGSYHVINTMSLSKHIRSAKKTTAENFEDWKERKDKEFGKGGEFNSYAPPVVAEGTPTTRINPETKKVEITSSAFLDYLQEARDKSNDEITFEFAVSKLRNRINTTKKEVLESPERTKNLALYTKVLNIFEKVKAGGSITKEEFELLRDYLPITIRVKRSDTSKGAGSFIAGKFSENISENFDALEGGIRTKILDLWLANDRKTENISGGSNNFLPGITAKWAYVAPGELNVDDNLPEGGNKLTDLQGVSLENMEIFAVSNDEDGRMYAKDYNTTQERLMAPFRTSGKKGLIFMKVATNTGSPFYTALMQKTLANTKELDLVMTLLEEMLVGDSSANFATKVDGKILEQLQKEIPLLYEAFEGSEITYEDLLRTIFYSGKEDTQLRTVISPKSKTLKIGDNTWNAGEFADPNTKHLIKVILGQKYFRTGFTNPSTTAKMLTVDNQKYLKYLVESKILSSHLKTGEPLFVGVPSKDGKHIQGVSAFLTPDSIQFDKSKIKEVAKKESGKKEIPIVKSTIVSNEIKEGVLELFESNPELAKAVYEALGFTRLDNVINEVFGNKDEATIENYFNNGLWWIKQSLPLSEIKLGNFGKRSDDENNKYTESLKQEGQKVPGIVDANGVLNDGYHRYFSLKNAGIDTMVVYMPISIEQKQQAQQAYSNYLESLNKPNTNPVLQGNQKPDVILPIGTSGSGKSTFIKTLPQENLIVISPDEMRVEFTGNINDKSKDKEIYEEAANRAVAAIKGKETPSQIYSKLGNKTKTPNIVIQSVYQTAGVQYAKSINGVFSLRVNGTNNHFGNPFSNVESEIQKGLIRTKSTKESVEKYIEWVLSPTTTIKLEQHKFIRELLQSGKLKGKPVVYYKELGEPSHATALDYLINNYDWVEKPKQVVFDTTNLTKDKRLPFIEAVKAAIPTANIQYKLMELNPELAKQRIKAQLNEINKFEPTIKENPVNIGAKFPKDQTKANYADGIIGYGTHSTGNYSNAFGGTRTSFKEKEIIMISVNGNNRPNQAENVEKTKKAIDKAIQSGVTAFIADNETIANSSHNSGGEGVIRNYLLSKGLSYKSFKGVGLYIVNRANVSDATIDRHAESYKQMLEDIKNEPISKYKELGSKQDIQGFKEFVRGTMIKKLNKQARVRLEAMGINTKELSQESIKVINGLQEANKLAKIKKTSEIESLINKANGKDQDYKNKPC